MDRSLALRRDELVTNPTARVPVCLCLDASGSMCGDPIDELNAGVETFFSELLADEIAKYSAEVCVVRFGDTAEKVLDFGALDRQRTPCLQADGSTPMGEAVNLALDLLENRKNEYKAAGVDYFQPWLVLMTDGQPTDDVESASRRASALALGGKLVVFPIGIGSQADLKTLARFSPKRPPLKLKEMRFKDFFLWLSKSVSKVSQSIPGQSIPLDVEGIKGWGQI